MSGNIELELLGNGRTKDTPAVHHLSIDGPSAHELMGFRTGWAPDADQLVGVARST